MIGDVNEAGKCPALFDSPVVNFTCSACAYDYTSACAKGYVIDLNYQSTTLLHSGSGRTTACVIDNGEGVNSTSSDLAWIRVRSGHTIITIKGWRYQEISTSLQRRITLLKKLQSYKKVYVNA